MIGDLRVVICYRFFFFHRYGAPRSLHSFPTRRSSDLYLLAGSFDEAEVQEELAALIESQRIALNQQVSPLAWSVRALKELADRKSTRLNSSHGYISYAVFCLKKTTHSPPLLEASRCGV